MALARHAAGMMLFASVIAGAPAVQADEITDVHAALNGLGRADLAGPSPRLLAMLERWRPKSAEKEPCAPGTGWISSDAVCEWYAPGANTKGAILPDMLLSLSRRTIDSVVFWGEMPLSARNWQCARVAIRPVSTVCVSLVVPPDRRARLTADWESLLGRIAAAGK